MYGVGAAALSSASCCHSSRSGVSALLKLSSIDRVCRAALLGVCNENSVVLSL